MFRVLILSSVHVALASSPEGPGWGLSTGGSPASPSPGMSKYPASPSPNAALVRAVATPDCRASLYWSCVTLPIMNHRQTTPASSFEAPDCTAPGRVGCLVSPLGAAAPPPGMPVQVATPMNYRVEENTEVDDKILTSFDVDGDGGEFTCCPCLRIILAHEHSLQLSGGAVGTVVRARSPYASL